VDVEMSKQGNGQAGEGVWVADELGSRRVDK
jgi:hypothetical protein